MGSELARRATRTLARRRIGLTPAGAGVLSLFAPGLLIAAATHQTVLIALCLAAGMLLSVDVLSARSVSAELTVTLTGPEVMTAGTKAAAVLHVSGPRPLDVVVAVAGTEMEPVSLVVPDTIDLPLRLDAPGVVEHLDVSMWATGWFGLSLGAVAVTARLPVPIHVAPAPVACDPGPAPEGAMFGGGTGRVRADDPVGLRPYAAGDSPRDVHWPAVARTGELQVRERTTADVVRAVTVVAATTGATSEGDDETERPASAVVAGRTRFVVERLLATGWSVNLLATEPGCHEPMAGVGSGGCEAVWRAGGVNGERGLLRRLALACMAGPADEEGGAEPTGAPPPAPGELRLVVDGSGARWHGVS